MTTVWNAVPADAPLSTGPGLSLRAVSKSYGATQVLRDVTAELPAGRIYGLLGANGAGKTTLMSVICNHTFRQGGQILVDGQDPAENPAALEKMCFVREDQAYNDSFRVREVLAVMPSFYPTWDGQLAERLAERFRLPRGTRCKKLSRGQRSALAIVLALGSRAAYTFLDEPYLGLDSSAREIFYDELIRDYAEHPRTIIMSTHLIDEAADLMERVLVLHEGQIVLDADTDEARASAYAVRGLDEQVRAFVGSREVLSERRLGRVASVLVRGRLDADAERSAAALQVALEPASLQDLVAAIGIHGLGDTPVQHTPEPAAGLEAAARRL